MEEGEKAVRRLCVTPDFDQWLTAVLPNLPKDRGRNLTPLGQVDALFHDYVIGRPMVYDHARRRLDPQNNNIWELKTEDVRVFGWFARRSHFIAVTAAMRKDLVPASRYTPFITDVAAFRQNLPLDPPKTTTGVSHNDVL